MQDLSGTTLGRYRLTRIVGRGGMATVYEALDPTLDRVVAVKVLAQHLVGEEGFLGRFQHEARAVAALRHPSIVHMYDFDTQGGVPYMVMEYIDGPSLQALLADLHRRSEAAVGDALPTTDGSASPGLPHDAVVRLMNAVCSALDYAHARGMVHRDIKPANVLLTADLEPVLSDFGIARIAGATTYTAPGMVMGTAHYMAPEQAQGLPIDGRCDQYAAAVLAFEALAGRVPYVGDTTGSVLAQHITAPVPSLSALLPSLPSGVDAVFARALAKEPDDRFPTAGDFAREMQAVLKVPERDAGGPLLASSEALGLLGPSIVARLRTRPGPPRDPTAAEPSRVRAAASAPGAVDDAPTTLERTPATEGVPLPPAERQPAGGAKTSAVARRSGSRRGWAVGAAAGIVIAAVIVVTLGWQPWRQTEPAGVAGGASPTPTATRSQDGDPAGTAEPTPSVSPTQTSSSAASPEPTAVAAAQPLPRALKDVSATSGAMARVGFLVEDEDSDRCKVRVVISDEQGTQVKAYGTRKDWWWKTNVAESMSFTCTLPPGVYRYHVEATDDDGNTGVSGDRTTLTVQ